MATLLVMVVAALLTAAGCSSGSGRDDVTSSDADTVAPGTTAVVAPATSAPSTTVGDPPVEPGVVVISDYRFVPKEITVPVGGTVTWRNTDAVDHWVVATTPDVLDSGLIGKASEFTEQFDVAGSYPYYCDIHNYMKGTVTVG